MKLKKRNHSKVDGLKIRSINTGIIVATSILVLCLFAATIYISQKYNAMVGDTNAYIELQDMVDSVQDASDHMTDQVRLFVQTMDPEYVTQYFEEANVARRRDLVLEQIKNYNLDNAIEQHMEEAVRHSNELMEQEIYGMKLVVTAKGYDESTFPAEVQDMELSAEDLAKESVDMIEKARMLMFDEAYQQKKALINEHLAYCIQGVFNSVGVRMINEREALSHSIYIERILLCILVLVNIFNFFASTMLVMKPLYAYLDSIKEQSALKASGAYEFKYLAQVYNDIYAKKNASEAQETQLRQKAERDLMTGLYNRISAEEQIRTMMAEEAQSGILVVLDMDDLKGINDTFGHKEGDKAILGIAEILKGHFSERDIIGRLGGDEFIIYLSEKEKEQAAVSESLRSLLRKLSGISVGTEEDRHHIHCSIGCAVQNASTSTFEELFAQADMALYHVKRRGKNNFAFYEEDMEQLDDQFRMKKLLLRQNAGGFDPSELPYLLNAIASVYPLVLSINLSNESYYLMKESEDDILPEVPVTGMLEQFFDHAVELVHPDDKVYLFNSLSTEALLHAYQSGEQHIHQSFRFHYQGEYRLMEGNVFFYTNGQGDVCDFTLLSWSY